MVVHRRNSDRALGEGSRKTRPIATRVLGVGLVLAVVALPVLFSDGLNTWNENQAVNPYAAVLTMQVEDAWHVAYAVTLLYRPGPTNETRVDKTTPVTVTHEIGGVLALDLTSGNVNPGPLLPDLSGYCCYSDHGFVVHNGTIFYTGTAPGGLLEFIEIDPAANVTTTRIDPTSINDFTGETEATTIGLLTLTSSTDTGETVVYGNTLTDTHDWNRLTSRTSNTVFDNDHPGMAVNPVTGEGFLLYTVGTDANLLKFDTVTGNTIWEYIDIVSVGTAPAGTFRYFQVDEDDGNVALSAPRTTDTMIVFIDDAGGPALPTDVRYHTVSGDPPGDRQILQLNGRIVTAVYPDQDGVGTEGRHVFFSPDPSAPPNVMTWEDNTVTGAWHNTAPGYAIFLTETGNPGSAVAYDIKPNRLLVVQGDPVADVVRYGTVELPVFFDGFESGALTFWGSSQQ